MISLMKLDLWLLRWALLVILIFAPLAGAFFYTNASTTGLIMVFVMSLTLIQMDEKQKTKRFMLSLPLPLKRFFQARSFVVIFVGVAWVILEALGSMIGLGDVAFGSLFLQTTAQLGMIMVLAPTAIALLTLFHHPVLKYGLTFLVYMVMVMIGVALALFMESLTHLNSGVLAYVSAAVFFIISGGVSWLILWIANKIRAQVDLV